MKSQKRHTRQETFEATRSRILDAATQEFSAYGLAGARTEAIARAAKVNKALVYYYFKSKDDLYAGALKNVMESVVRSTEIIFEYDCTPGEKMLRLVLNHFDRVLSQNHYQRLVQQEMIRFHAGEASAIPAIARNAFGPLFGRMRLVIQQGIRSRELLNQDWMQIFYSGYGGNVFYALSASLVRIALEPEKFEPFAHNSLLARRKAAIRFLANAIFADRAHGQTIARRVLESMPLPEVDPPRRMRRTA